MRWLVVRRDETGRWSTPLLMDREDAESYAEHLVGIGRRVLVVDLDTLEKELDR